MDRFVYPPSSVYQSYGRTFTSSHNVPPQLLPRQKQASWKQSKNSRTPNLCQGPPPALSLDPWETLPDYLNTFKWAQLKALLSQFSPDFTPWLHKTTTKEIGIQVNPRVDAAVQCSLGSRLLPSFCPQRSSAYLTREPPLLGIYSPVLGQHLFTLPERVVEPQEQAKASTLHQLAKKEPEVKAAWETGKRAVGEEPPEENPDEQSAPWQDWKGEASKKGGNVGGEGKIVSFQFLEQKYGYFHCNHCKTRWESAYVWCIPGTNKVYYKQLCHKCQKGFNPYKVEAILCQLCSKARCSCPQKKRHIDLKRPHRQELCGRCKGKRLSCDNTYSFKYIV